MKSKPPLVVKLEAWISFLIPFLSGVAGIGALSDTYWGKVSAVTCSAIVAGLSGLKSFLSTTFADSRPDAPVEPPKPEESLIKNP